MATAPHPVALQLTHEKHQNQHVSNRPLDDRQRAARDQLIEGCRLQTARTELSGYTVGEETSALRRVVRGDVLG